MAASDLTSLANVKEFLNIANTEDDELLSRLITECSGAASNYINRTILSQSYTEKYDGNDSDVLMVRQTPVTAVTSLANNGIPIQLSSDGVTKFGFTFDDNCIIMVKGVFPRGRRNIVVAYTAGYALIPVDVEEAIIEFVSDRYRMRGRIGEKSKALPQGGSVSYDTSYMSDKVKGSLSNYRRLIPI